MTASWHASSRASCSLSIWLRDYSWVVHAALTRTLSTLQAASNHPLSSTKTERSLSAAVAT
ncbi:hypothetical protein E2562_038694 [Oryza meyeriana var. granulata]|uniref:Uncharacterized protein n=1 Tax=Oryza meyeriana var. granulata TaxID=110450 RepID=A0A6G1CXU5_9ORYZ|nr:hypothetical protein E2562_038694 [Oryza meyeriana var. granulata]